MPAHNEAFPWLPYYGHFKFIESRLSNHRCVEKIEIIGESLYTVTRTQGDSLKLFVCECYSFGVAEFLETKTRIPSLDAILINSMWCGYTTDAKHQCYQDRIGLFQIAEFMGGLNFDDCWAYLTEGQIEQFKEKGWL